MNAEEIIELAENLSTQHHNSIGGGGDPYAAFSDYEVVVAEDDFAGSFEGLLRYHDGEFQTFIDTSHERNKNLGRRRFTVAHEFGHFSIPAHRHGIRHGHLLHRSQVGFESRERIEREADIFAAYFLIPTDELRKLCENGDWGAKEILKAARHFNSSITAAALRCQASLGGYSTLILWQGETVVWQRTNRDWWFELPARAIRCANRLARDSATDLLVRQNATAPESGFLSNGTTRSQWFPRVADWSRDNAILVEYAIPLGSFGVLTLLRPDR